MEKYQAWKPICNKIRTLPLCESINIIDDLKVFKYNKPYNKNIKKSIKFNSNKNCVLETQT